MPNTANTRIITLLPSSFDVLHGTHDDRLVREYPTAQDWHRRELLRKPKCIEQVEFNGEVDATTVTSEDVSGAPGQAGGYRHSANDSVTAVVVLSSIGIFHHPNLAWMVLDTVGPAQSPPAIRNKKLETPQFETSTSTKTPYLLGMVGTPTTKHPLPYCSNTPCVCNCLGFSNWDWYRPRNLGLVAPIPLGNSCTMY